MRRRPGGATGGAPGAGQVEASLEGSCQIDWITLTGARNAGKVDVIAHWMICPDENAPMTTAPETGT